MVVLSTQSGGHPGNCDHRKTPEGVGSEPRIAVSSYGYWSWISLLRTTISWARGGVETVKHRHTDTRNVCRQFSGSGRTQLKCRGVDTPLWQLRRCLLFQRGVAVRGYRRRSLVRGYGPGQSGRRWRSSTVADRTPGYRTSPNQAIFRPRTSEVTNCGGNAHMLRQLTKDSCEERRDQYGGGQGPYKRAPRAVLPNAQ